MNEDKGKSLVGIVIAIILVGVLVTLIFLGMKIMDEVEEQENENITRKPEINYEQNLEDSRIETENNTTISTEDSEGAFKDYTIETQNYSGGAYLYKEDGDTINIANLDEEWIAELGIKNEKFDNLVKEKAEWKAKLERQGYTNVNPKEKTIGGIKYLVTYIEWDEGKAIAAYVESPNPEESFTLLVTSTDNQISEDVLEEISKQILNIKY